MSKSFLAAIACIALLAALIAGGCAPTQTPSASSASNTPATTSAVTATAPAKSTEVTVPVAELKVRKDQWKKTVVGIVVRGDDMVVRVKKDTNPTSEQAAAMKHAASAVNTRLKLGATHVILVDAENGYTLSYGPTD